MPDNNQNRTPGTSSSQTAGYQRYPQQPRQQVPPQQVRPQPSQQPQARPQPSQQQVYPSTMDTAPQNKRIRNIIITMVVALVIVLGAAVFWYFQLSAEEAAAAPVSSSPTTAAAPTTTPTPTVIEETVDISSEMTGYCAFYENLRFESEDDCYVIYATGNRSKKLCSYITSTAKKDDCIMQIAVLEKKPSYCKELGKDNEADIFTCYFSQLPESKDLKFCNQIKNEKLKNWCKVRLTSNYGSVEECGSFEKTEYKDLCYMDFAQNKNDYSHCDKIYAATGNFSKEACKLSLVLGGSTDEKLCGALSSTAQKDSCYLFLTYNTEDNHCDKMQGENNRISCITELAKIKKDYRLCEGLAEEGAFLEESCMITVAVSKNDTAKCDSLENSDLCYKSHALSELDESMCDRISDSTEKEDCADTVVALAI